MPLQITVGGRLAGAQRWSMGFGFRLTPDGGLPSAEALTTLANQLFSDFNTTWFSTTTSGSLRLGAQMGTRSSFDSVRTYYTNAPGSPALVVGASTTASVAGTAGGNQPPQIAAVCTLLTGRAGRSYRGRVYVPINTGTDTDGTFAASVAQAQAQACANFLSAAATRSLNGGVLIPCVTSATRAENTPITAVRVDNVLDTQRRRRDKIVATARPQSSLVIP